MVKMVAFFKRKPGLSVEAFQAYWRTKHAEVVLRLPGIRRYVQSHTLRSGYRQGEPVYDGIAEVWFDDTQAMRVSAMLPEYERVRADEQAAYMNGHILFVDGGYTAIGIAEE